MRIEAFSGSRFDFHPPLSVAAVLEGFGRCKQPHRRQQRQPARRHHAIGSRRHRSRRRWHHLCYVAQVNFVPEERGLNDDVSVWLLPRGPPEEACVEADAAGDGQAVGPLGQLRGGGCRSGPWVDRAREEMECGARKGNRGGVDFRTRTRTVVPDGGGHARQHGRGPGQHLHGGVVCHVCG